MTRPNQNALQRGRWLLRLGAHLIDEIYHGAILPALLFWWHSIADLVELQRANPVKPAWRQLLVPLLWLERRIPPAGGQPRWPRKLALLLVVVIGVTWILGSDTTLEDLRRDGELVVVSRESATTLTRDGDVTRGPVYDYLNSFAQFLGVDLRFEMRDNSREVHDAIARDEGHIGAAGMTYHPPLRDRGVLFGPGYQDVDIQVVCRRNHGKRPRSLEDMDEVELVVVADSPYESRLFELQRDYPDLSWESDEDADVDDLLELVWRKEIGCTIANSSQVNIKATLLPRAADRLHDRGEPAAGVDSVPGMGNFIGFNRTVGSNRIERDGTLIDAAAIKHYHEQATSIMSICAPSSDVCKFTPASALSHCFRKYAEQVRNSRGPCSLHNPIRSRTGIAARSSPDRRARHHDVDADDRQARWVSKSRLDVEQSIMGGAKYLSRLVPTGARFNIGARTAGGLRWRPTMSAWGTCTMPAGWRSELELDPDNWIDLQRRVATADAEKILQETEIRLRARPASRSPTYARYPQLPKTSCMAQLGQSPDRDDL